MIDDRWWHNHDHNHNHICICIRNEHASRDIRHKSADMSTQAETFNTNGPSGLGHHSGRSRFGCPVKSQWKSLKIEGNDKNTMWMHPFQQKYSTRAKTFEGICISIRKTFDTNQQTWARELRHPKKSTSTAAMSTRAKTFDTNQQKWAGSTVPVNGI